MTSRHIANKFFEKHKHATIRYNDQELEKLLRFAEKEYGKDILEINTSQLHKDFILANNGFEKIEEEVEEEPLKFDCNKLCKKHETCTSNAMFDSEEIKALNCYISMYPYEYKGNRVCKFMFFPEGFPHDPENPYPQCINPKPLVHMPRDRIIQNPQICWVCYKLQKKAREKELLKKVVREDFRGQPRVNWYPSNSY